MVVNSHTSVSAVGLLDLLVKIAHMLSVLGSASVSTRQILIFEDEERLTTDKLVYAA